MGCQGLLSLLFPSGWSFSTPSSPALVPFSLANKYIWVSSLMEDAVLPHLLHSGQTQCLSPSLSFYLPMCSWPPVTGPVGHYATVCGSSATFCTMCLSCYPARHSLLECFPYLGLSVLLRSLVTRYSSVSPYPSYLAVHQNVTISW